jgi:hypothetical protein
MDINACRAARWKRIKIMHLPHASQPDMRYSFDAGYRALERRASARQISVMLTAKLNSGNMQQPCRIVNLSVTGAKLETLIPLTEGEPVLVEFRSDLVIKAKVRWTREGQAGIEFDAPIALQAALRRSEVQIGRIKARPPRYRCDARATVENGNKRWQCHVVDISSTGLKIRGAGAVAIRETVMVEIEGLPRHRARVIWTGADMIGLRLLNAFKYHELELWILSHGRSSQGA